MQSAQSAHDTAPVGPGDPARRLLLVAGSGRSGTSLFAGLCSRLGWHIPQPEVAENDSNPRGFSEPRWLVDFHHELLRAANVVVEDGRPEAWTNTTRIVLESPHRDRLKAWLEEQFEQSATLAVKDPRLGWFLDAYRELAPELGASLHVVTMLRDPAEVLRSREVAYGTRTNNNARAAGWITMMLGVEQRTRDLPRAIVTYDSLLADWRATLSGVETALELPLVSGASAAQLAAADDLVDPGLRRSRVEWSEIGLHPGISDRLRRVYECYGDLVGSAADPSAAAAAEGRLDELWEEFTAYYQECFDVAVHRTGARVRRERAKATAQALQDAESSSAPSSIPSTPSTPSTRQALRQLAGSVSRSLRTRTRNVAAKTGARFGKAQGR